MEKKFGYRLYIWLTLLSGAILAIALIITSFKALQADRNFSRLILEENKTFLVNTLRFGHGMMRKIGAKRYQDLINLALKSKFIRYLAVLDKEGRVIAQSEPLEGLRAEKAYDSSKLGNSVILKETKDLLLISYEATEIVSDQISMGSHVRGMETKREDHKPAGYYLVGLGIFDFKKHFRSTVIQTVSTGAVILLFGILIIVFLGIVQRYELAHLSIERLHKIKGVLSNFVPSTAKDIIEKDPERALLEKYIHDATILFLDMEGFTTLVQQYPHERINNAIEFYFSAFFDVIQKSGGDINETAGDGMMVIFLNPDPNQHARNAVQAALEIQRKCREVSTAEDAHLFPIRVNIGISSGEVYMGSTKMRGSGGDRWTFTASGSITILAARLSQYGRGGQILIGEQTAQRIKKIFPLNHLGKVPLKNVNHSGEVYHVLGP
jgi:class 3 adenylate cyclase